MKASISRVASALAFLLVVGCGRAAVPVGYDAEPYPLTAPPKKPAPAEHVPADVVARAAAAVRLVRLADQVELTFPRAARELLKHEALCAGERHGVAALHFGEVTLLDRLAAPARDLGLELGVGLEMWATRYQADLSRFALGKIDEQSLLERTEYEERWGFSFAYYRPLLERARGMRLPLVALNAPREVTREVAEKGLDELSPAVQKQLPSLELDDATHRQDFARRMQNHPGVDADSLERYYSAQVVWDETMAESAASWLNDHAPVRRLLIVAGQAHCQRSAIPNRLERRGARDVGAIWLGTSSPPPEVAKQYDYALIIAGPPESENSTDTQAAPDSSVAARPSPGPGAY